MYSRVSEKGPLYYNYSHFINRIIFTLYVAIITNKNKIRKPVSKETFVEALKVVVKLSKVIN